MHDFYWLFTELQSQATNLSPNSARYLNICQNWGGKAVFLDKLQKESFCVAHIHTFLVAKHDKTLKFNTIKRKKKKIHGLYCSWKRKVTGCKQVCFWNAQKLSSEQLITQRLFIYWKGLNHGGGANSLKEIVRSKHLSRWEATLVMGRTREPSRDWKQNVCIITCRQKPAQKARTLSFKTELQSGLPLCYSKWNPSSPANKCCRPNKRIFYSEPFSEKSVKNSKIN